MSTPFTTSWIQALIPAADLPVARSIRPSMEWVDQVCALRSPEEMTAAAQALWSYSEQNGLLGLLHQLPVLQSEWRFFDDETFSFERLDSSPPADLESWTAALGGGSYEVPLQAQVTHADWSTLVRSEAVRLQQSFDVASRPSGNLLRVPCVANWTQATWTICFTNMEWLKLEYEEPAIVPRPPVESTQALVEAALAHGQQLLPKNLPAIEARSSDLSWISCAPRLEALHEQVLGLPEDGLHAWCRRAWLTVWPVVYREQNILAGKADLDEIRSHLKQCLKHAPQTTAWLFVLAKLVCETQLGRGLGLAADFVDHLGD